MKRLGLIFLFLSLGAALAGDRKEAARSEGYAKGWAVALHFGRAGRVNPLLADNKLASAARVAAARSAVPKALRGPWSHGYERGYREGWFRLSRRGQAVEPYQPPPLKSPEQAGYRVGREAALVQASDTSPEYVLRPSIENVWSTAANSAANNEGLQTERQRKLWVQGYLRGFGVGWAEGLEVREEERARERLWD